MSDTLEVARAHSIVDPTWYNSTDYYYYQGGQPAHGVSNVRRKDCVQAGHDVLTYDVKATDWCNYY